MPFEFLDDAVTSDVTFRAWGGSLEEMFCAAVDATTALMLPALETLRTNERVPLAITGESLEDALWRLLEEIVFHKDASGLLLRVRELRVDRTPSGEILAGELHGEKIDRGRHVLATDVKAITLHGLTVLRNATGWSAQVTVDV